MIFCCGYGVKIEEIDDYQMFISKIVSNYASAIFDAAGDNFDKIIQQLNKLNELSELLKAEYNQTVFKEGKGQKILISIVKKLEFDDIIVNLFTKLINKNRIKILSKICDYLPVMMLKRSGISQAEVRSVAPLSKVDEDSIKSYLKNNCGKEVEIKNLIDESLLGGVVVSFDSFLLDASMLTKLAKAKDYLSKNKEL